MLKQFLFFKLKFINHIKCKVTDALANRIPKYQIFPATLLSNRLINPTITTL